MTRLYTFIIFILCYSTAIAQSNFKPGYVVNLKGDTLKGLIDYREWSNNPKEIHFKPGAGGSAQVYNVRNTNAFAITGTEYFERFILPISTDTVDINKLSTKLDTASYIDTVFLRVSTTGGRLTMYRYVDVIKSRYYILEHNEKQPQELVYHLWYDPSESSAVHYSRRFRGQLTALAQKYKANSSALETLIQESNYTESDLLKIVEKINGPSVQAFTPQGVGGIRFFAGLSVNYSTLQFHNAQSGAIDGSTTTNANSIYPKIEAGVDFFVNKNTRQLIIRLEVAGTENQYKITTANSGVPASTSTLNFTQYNTSIVPQLIFNIIANKPTELFIDAGAAFNVSGYNKYQYITKYGGSFPDDIQNNYPAFSGFWTSFPLRAGLLSQKA